MRRTNIIPVEYYLAKRRYYCKELERLPRITSGIHLGKEVYRYYYRGKVFHEISPSSKDWEMASEICSKRNNIRSVISNINGILNTCFRNAPKNDEIKLINTNSRYGIDYYEQHEDSSCSVTNNTGYFYNGRHYRSRGEMQIAAMLDDHDLEFKYDVNVMLNGRLYSFDFMIIFREFNRCVFLEYLGRSEMKRYMIDNANKLIDASGEGLYLGRDIYVISGDESYTPGNDSVEITISAMIANICTYHLGR